MHDYFSIFDGKSFAVLSTVGLIVFSQLVRSLTVRFIEKIKTKEDENYRHTINVMKNFINIGTLVLIFILWSSEIQQFAISIAAFTVAIVVATKELLQSFLGFIYITSSRIFKVGDWIKVGEDLGEVIDITWSKTSLLEISNDKYGFTGKTTYISNLLLLTLTIQNLNFMKRYVHYSFTLTKEEAGINPFGLKDELIEKIKLNCEAFENTAERYNSVIENKLGIKFINNNEPHVEINTTSIGKIDIKISFFCPTEQIQPLKDKITSDFFDLWYEKIDLKKEKEKQITVV